LRQLTAALVFELQSGGNGGDAKGNAELRAELICTSMSTTTLLIIIVVLLLLFGGGFYGRGRWY
jgi:hypothetical protein